MDSRSKTYCSELTFPLLYISVLIIPDRVYINVFHDIIYFYSLTTTQTSTFRYIKWPPHVALTGSFLDVVFGQYVRGGMGVKTVTKNSE